MNKLTTTSMAERVTGDGDFLLLTHDKLNVMLFIDRAQSDDGGAISTFLGTTRN